MLSQTNADIVCDRQTKNEDEKSFAEGYRVCTTLSSNSNNDFFVRLNFKNAQNTKRKAY